MIKLVIFILAGIVFTGMFGIVPALLITKREKKKRGLKIILIDLAIGFVCSLVLTVDYAIDEHNWNNGYCSECGNEWELFDVEKGYHNTSTHNIYKCENCDNTIDTIFRFKK